MTISIHALLAESDPLIFSVQPRKTISIHALLAESDLEILLHCLAIPNFYPRSPCGERLEGDRFFYYSDKFLSTLSLRRATVTRVARTPTTVISIHALLAESDRNVFPDTRQHDAISIHALLAESDN